ncbi:MAG: 4-hydroxy-tetrahydrodipicolinate synthase [Rickettsia sp.]|nr:4-hydroxy-tetrahydrodipicolinate synthase [Rickettsia sp.]
MFKGITTALITPFTNDLEIDFESLERILKFQINSNIDFVLLGGSTGEGFNLMKEEYLKLVQISLEILNNKKPLIANISSANYRYSLELLKNFNDTSLYGVISTPPYYSMPSQDGIFSYFQEIDKNTKKPVLLYNHPKRTSVDIKENLLVSLSKLKNIFALKNSVDDSNRYRQINDLLKLNYSQLELISGDDSTFFYDYMLGSEGLVSVIGNIFPNLIKEIFDLLESQNYKQAFNIFSQIFPIFDILKLEVNPVVIKYIAFLQKLILTDKIRLPLIGLNEVNKLTVQNKLTIFMKFYNEINCSK